jgi:hypothetical protein
VSESLECDLLPMQSDPFVSGTITYFAGNAVSASPPPGDGGFLRGMVDLSRPYAVLLAPSKWGRCLGSIESVTQPTRGDIVAMRVFASGFSKESCTKEAGAEHAWYAGRIGSAVADLFPLVTATNAMGRRCLAVPEVAGKSVVYETSPRSVRREGLGKTRTIV